MPEQLDKLVVFKIGSSTLVDERGAADVPFIRSLARQIATLRDAGWHVVMVSSGAAATGWEQLGFSSRPHDIPSLQACAAAGQARLTEVYAHELAELGIPCGQVLLTRRDVVDREGYLNARNTLLRLLDLGAVPVVNENDTVSVAEFTFGDNDMLGAIVAALVGASLYVMLSDVDGLYTANPSTHPEAKLLRHVSAVDASVMALGGGAGSSVGTGGMASKLRAARGMIAAGVPTIICNGRVPNALVQAVSGKEVGTRFEADASRAPEGGRKLWIGLAEVARGTLAIDDGAKEAVLHDGASVLPVGVTRSEGTYQVGDVVNVVDATGALVGRGVVRYSSEEMESVRGLRLDVIARFLPGKAGQPAIHRDELLVF